MKKASYPHIFAVWFTCLALVFAMLAPTVARANANTGWAEVCSAAGMKLVQVDNTDGPEQPSGSLMNGEHCPFCHLHADVHGAVPQLPAMIHPASVRLAMPRLFLQAPRTLSIWAPAQSRAPPAND